MQFEERVFFENTSPDIFMESSQSRRHEMINDLETTNPFLYQEWFFMRSSIEQKTEFMRNSGRYPLSAIDKFNLYATFAEFAEKIINSAGHVGLIVKGGYITDKLCANLFADHMRRKCLASVFEFENKKKLFPNVHPQERFALITFGRYINKTDFCFDNFLTEQLRIQDNHVWMDYQDILLLSPNTQNCPKFPNNIEYGIAKKCYLNAKPLVRHDPAVNPWNITIDRYINVSDMSDEIVKNIEYSLSKLFSMDTKFVPIFEGKLFHQYDHRFASYVSNSEETFEITDKSREIKVSCLRYISPATALRRNPYLASVNGLLAVRDITNRTNERGVIATIIPACCTDYTVRVVEPIDRDPLKLVLLVSIFNSLICDYLARQRIGGSHLSNYILEQIPVLLPENFSKTNIDFIKPRVLELTYTANDLKPFAEDMGYHDEPYKWDEERRALLRAELDAYYAKLYGLTRDELRYILDPKEVYGEDFPGETFRVLKDKEMRLYGEFRTRRLVLEAWDRLDGVEINSPETRMQEVITVAPPTEIRRPEKTATVATPAKPARDEKPAPVKKEVFQPIDESSTQPSFSDFGLYECSSCGKRVMGFDQGKHIKEIHAGKGVEWKKIR
ncbi:MAG: hypothetical protein NT121_04335 [Chloroflexi bacterium]|nr:hypothetical protein [Chloroflexota bacterium]